MLSSATLGAKLQAYLRQCTDNRIIVYSGDEHASAINALCMEKKIGPVVEFKAYDGYWRKANCMLSVVQFLKSIGQYDDSKNTKFQLVEYRDTRDLIGMTVE